MGLALDDIRSRFDSARQQLIEEAVAVSRSGGMTSTGNLLKGIEKKPLKELEDFFLDKKSYL